MANAQSERERKLADERAAREREQRTPPPPGEDGGAADQDIDTAGTDIDEKSPTKSIGTGIPNPD